MVALVVVRDDLLPGALLRGGVAAGARAGQATRGAASVAADCRQAPTVVVLSRRAEVLDVLNVSLHVHAHEVVRVALELGREVRGEEGHVVAVTMVAWKSTRLAELSGNIIV